MSRNFLLSVAVSAVCHGGAAALFLVQAPATAGAPVAMAPSIQLELIDARTTAAAASDHRAAPAPSVEAKADGPGFAKPQTQGVSGASRADHARGAVEAVAAESVDVGAVSEYYRVLQGHLARYHAYPSSLRTRPTGLVRLGVVVGRDGRVLDAWIENSSGITVLDDAAMAALRRAEPLPSLPASLPGAIDLIVPLRYEAGLKAAS
ncbi:energy transducer TonB [Brevundimonas nasdae]|uniref:energy transducer TonB n=1 Tax=Brevundimonas nasdae TaxID=172043 RepID=UPI0028A04F82|nr:TonB family protein [Brevundimonas nasdae]